MRYFSSFTGGGGFDLAMPSDWQCVGFCEIDKYANMVLKYRFPDVKNYGDVNEINWNEIPDFDILLGGTPCQDLSLAGKRKGLSGERSGLFFEFVKALKAKKPEYFIWENVKGALSSNHGYDFAEVLNQFSEAGYSFWWQVLNAKDFGVPQNRERIFIVGFRDRSPPEVFFEPESYGRNNKEEQATSTIGATAYKGAGSNMMPLIEIVESEQHPQEKEITEVKSMLNLGMQGRRIKENNEPSFTLNTLGEIGIKVNSKIRRLTPKECERLMSWSDGWTRWGMDEKGNKVEMSDTQRYKMAGNGVVSNVVKWLVENVLQVDSNAP